MDIQYLPVLPSDPRPICIIGAGGIVKDAHLPAYAQAGFKVHSIYNRSKAKAEALAELFDIPHVFDDIAQQVANAPSNAIFDLALMPAQFIQSLELLPDGAAVLIQKPMGDDQEHAKAILEICNRKQLKAAVNCQLRFAPFVAAARSIIEQGLIGELYDLEVRVTVHTPWEYFPNVINHPRLEIQQHSVHYIDLLRSFLGEPSRVLAKTVGHPANKLSSTRSTIIMDYGDKQRAVINTNHDHRFGISHQDSFIKWEGTKGAIVAKLGLLMNYPEGLEDKFEYCIVDDSNQVQWHTLKLEGSWFPEAFVGSMAELQRFVCGDDSQLRTSVEDVYQSMYCVEQAYASSDAS
ncbi:gfo/Idh/MocA family oxidoreductase [Alginatibacterium sediminis]|uniref:Gfo/Idh/MocA family oxidoreductase n=1 Tax=Alginatibacterium sediminis TaxID=2164068 RepID=A0A420EGH6_9ALTE|nr:Gfo/Idh/MocA family oxidoreductase [Alginatibacterium sediminis]RKF19777.1 gfo/Idh/MocA family oxidoreductase [Alginatibacterium sediminis]